MAPPDAVPDDRPQVAAPRALMRHWGALLALALFLIAGLAVLDDYGVSPDVAYQRATVEANLGYLASGGLRAFTNALLVDHEKFYGTAFEAPLLLIERVGVIDDNPRAVNLIRHLHSRLLFLAGGLFAYLLALRLFGSRLLALFAMGFFLLHPRLYGHSFFNPKDIPFLAMFIVALYLTHRAFRRDGVAAFALLGASLGLLINLRIMGVVLLAAVPALRALDFALAQGWAERKRVLLTTGAFALASGVAIFALLPYLWGDPVGRGVEWWTTLSNHPYQPEVLFRGTLHRSVDLPADYLPTWFAMTAPPFALLLGLIGAGSVFGGVAKARSGALRNGRLRFALMLVGCFALPIIAVMLLSGNIYDGWRQMYFLWAPFALLAAFGLRALATALGRRRLTAAAYGAASVGLTAAVVSMSFLHPNQQISFNFFVDRVAPEHLRTQFTMDYWSHSYKQALEWLLDRPRLWDSAPSVTGSADAASVRNAEVLSKQAKERVPGVGFAAFAIGSETSARPDLKLHRINIYGSALLTIERKADLQAVYAETLSKNPIRDSVFDVYRLDGALALVKKPCAPSFINRTGFGLRTPPLDPSVLSPLERRKGFEDRGFWLVQRGAFFDGKCVASIPLPGYPMERINFNWSPELLGDGEARRAVRRVREAGPPLARAAHRSGYDVYLGGEELVYVNDSCDPTETERSFHLNAFPERPSDLPDSRRKHGFERFHFEFYRNGALVDGKCIALFPLPDYPIVGVQTGQYTEDGGDLWYAEFLINPARRWADASAGASGEPVAQDVFDVYLANRALVYLKEPCERRDANARFFLHIFPERVGDLPDERREHGFDNLDFAFFPNGALFDGKCAAQVPLPEYAIASIRTGQFVRGGNEVWRTEFPADLPAS